VPLMMLGPHSENMHLLWSGFVAGCPVDASEPPDRGRCPVTEGPWVCFEIRKPHPSTTPGLFMQPPRAWLGELLLYGLPGWHSLSTRPVVGRSLLTR